jgi:hypothetical protein
LQKLKLNLLKTQQTATQERLAVGNNSVALANKNRITGEKLDLSGAWLKMQDLLSVQRIN